MKKIIYLLCGDIFFSFALSMQKSHKIIVARDEEKKLKKEPSRGRIRGSEIANGSFAVGVCRRDTMCTVEKRACTLHFANILI